MLNKSSPDSDKNNSMKLIENMKIKMMRRFLRMSDDLHSKDFVVKCVANLDEFKEALSLLHDCYVKKGLMKPHPSGLRVMPHHLLPETNIMIVLHNGKVVATGTIVHRGLIKLPSYSAFSDKFSFYTEKEADSHEFSALAVHPEYRKRKNVLQLLLTKYYVHLMNLVYKKPYLLCAVHPKAGIFYKVLFNLDYEKKVIDHQSVDGAPAIFVKGDVAFQTIRNLHTDFRGDTEKTNFAFFMTSEDSRFIFPETNKIIFFDPIYYYKLTQEIYPYLLNNGIINMDLYKKVMVQVRHFLPVGDNVEYFYSNKRPYRGRSSLDVKDKNNNIIGRIDNMSINGLLVKLNKGVQLSGPNGIVSLFVEIDEKTTQLEAKIIRVDFTNDQINLGLQLVDTNKLIIGLTENVEKNIRERKIS